MSGHWRWVDTVCRCSSAGNYPQRNPVDDDVWVAVSLFLERAVFCWDVHISHFLKVWAPHINTDPGKLVGVAGWKINHTFFLFFLVLFCIFWGVFWVICAFKRISKKSRVSIYFSNLDGACRNISKLEIIKQTARCLYSSLERDIYGDVIRLNWSPWFTFEPG